MGIQWYRFEVHVVVVGMFYMNKGQRQSRREMGGTPIVLSQTTVKMGGTPFSFRHSAFQ